MKTKIILIASVALILPGIFFLADDVRAISCGNGGTCENSCSPGTEPISTSLNEVGCGEMEVCCAAAAASDSCEGAGGKCGDWCEGASLDDKKCSESQSCCKKPGDAKFKEKDSVPAPTVDQEPGFFSDLWNKISGGGSQTPGGGKSSLGNEPQTPGGGQSPVTLNGKGIEIPTDTGLPAPAGGMVQIARNLLTWLLTIVGVIALMGFIISGIQYLVSAGNEDMMKSAKRNMFYAILGTIIVLGSFVIIQAIQYALQAESMF